jgi:uncharacterized short protein YbdD (DUF466 family)
MHQIIHLHNADVHTYLGIQRERQKNARYGASVVKWGPGAYPPIAAFTASGRFSREEFAKYSSEAKKAGPFQR